MNKILKGITFAFALFAVQSIQAQQSMGADSTGLAGDNFSLQGALELFKKSKNPEAFERSLNDESTSVNNLDLNQDGKTDYIKVKDIGDKNAHALILQVDVNDKEVQDIAIITLEKTGENSAAIQIKGAEELYGKDKLIEPMEEVIKSGKGGPDASLETYFVYVNVWFWPCVQFIYAPGYIYWESPWYWNYYPTWWSPWHVRPWYVHYHACYHYHPYYHTVYEYRNYDAYGLYGPRKSTAASVAQRYERSEYKSRQEHESKRREVVGSDRVQQMTTKTDTSTRRTPTASDKIEQQSTSRTPANVNQSTKTTNRTEETQTRKNRIETNPNDSKRQESSNSKQRSSTVKEKSPTQPRNNQPTMESRPSRERDSQISKPQRSQSQPSMQRSTPTPQRSTPTPQRNPSSSSDSRRK